MRKVCLALTVLATMAVAKTTNYNFTVDWDQAEQIAQNIGQEIDQFSKDYHNTVKNATKGVAKALEDAYKNTHSKMIMEMNGYLSDVYGDYADLLEAGQVNASCNEDCAVKCFNPKKLNVYNSNWTFGFNKTCFRRCGCEFLFESWTSADQKEFQNEVKEYQDSVNALNRFLGGLANEAKNILKPKIDAYAKAVSSLEDEFNQLVVDVSADLGCDGSCTTSCASTYKNLEAKTNCIATRCNCDAVADLIQ